MKIELSIALNVNITREVEVKNFDELRAEVEQFNRDVNNCKGDALANFAHDSIGLCLEYGSPVKISDYSIREDTDEDAISFDEYAEFVDERDWHPLNETNIDDTEIDADNGVDNGIDGDADNEAVLAILRDPARSDKDARETAILTLIAQGRMGAARAFAEATAHDGWRQKK